MPSPSLTPSLDVFAACTKLALAGPPKAVVIYTVAMSPEFAAALAEKLKEHYATAKILEKWGRKKVAEFLLKKTPASLVGKSGDLGEILATELVNAGHVGPYTVPINRLRWKDSKELPMRGDDLLAVAFNEQPIKFLKAEAKSRQKLSAGVVTKARKALEKNKGLPLPHTLAFLIERLYEKDEDVNAKQLEPYLMEKLPAQSQVGHMIFTFSGNDPSKLFVDEIKLASKKFAQHSIGVCASDHPGMIDLIFTKATSG